MFKIQIKKQDAEKNVQLNLLKTSHNYENLNQRDDVEQQQSTSSSSNSGQFCSPQSIMQENLLNSGKR